MSIITAGSAFTKGAEVLVTLVKSELLLVSQVSSDSYYSDSSNWKQVAIHYKSTVGNQREIMFFDATQSTPTAKFSVSLKSRNSFAVQKIVIKDFDNGSLEIPRAALNVVDFDVSFQSVSSVLSSALVSLILMNGGIPYAFLTYSTLEAGTTVRAEFKTDNSETWNLAASNLSNTAGTPNPDAPNGVLILPMSGNISYQFRITAIKDGVEVDSVISATLIHVV